MCEITPEQVSTRQRRVLTEYTISQKLDLHLAEVLRFRPRFALNLLPDLEDSVSLGLLAPSEFPPRTG